MLMDLFSWEKPDLELLLSFNSLDFLALNSGFKAILGITYETLSHVGLPSPFDFLSLFGLFSIELTLFVASLATILLVTMFLALLATVLTLFIASLATNSLVTMFVTSLETSSLVTMFVIPGAQGQHGCI